MIYQLRKKVFYCDTNAAFISKNSFVTNHLLVHSFLILRLILCVFFLDLEYLPFISLGVTSEVERIYFPSHNDATSETISITEGFPFGSSLQDSVYVSKFWEEKLVY